MKKHFIYIQILKSILIPIGIGSIFSFLFLLVQPGSAYAQGQSSSQTQIPSVSQRSMVFFTSSLHTIGSHFGNTEQGIGTGVQTLAATVAGIPATGGKVFHHISQSLLKTEDFIKETFAQTTHQVTTSFSFFIPHHSVVIARNTSQGTSIHTPQHQVLAAQNMANYSSQSTPQQTIVSLPNYAGALQYVSTTATNILHNSSFEEQTNEQPRDWNYQLDSNIGNTFIFQEGNRSGVFGLKFLGGGTGNRGISQPTVKTVPGRTYTFSLYMKTTNAPGNTTLRFGFWDEYHNTEGQMKAVAIPVTEDWTRYSVTVTTSGFITDPKNEFPLIEVEELTTGAVYVDDAQLEEGSVLTTYNSAQAQTTIAGDGSVGFSTGGDVYPITNGTGSVGTITNKFSALNLSNATIDSNGNLSLNGGFTANGTGEIKGALTLDNSLIIKGNTTFTGSNTFNNPLVFSAYGTGLLHSDGSGNITSSAVNLAANDVTNTLSVANGGTGITSITPNSLLYGNGTSGLQVLSPGTTGYVLSTNGSNAAPSWIAASGLSAGSVPFSGITSATNTSAAMLVGTGASLAYTGTGTLNANQLLSGTWAVPGAIGSTTTNTGAFTALSASGVLSANGGLSVPLGQNLTLSGFTPGSVPYINSNNQLAQDNSNFFWDATNHRLGLGTTSPAYNLDINGQVRITSSSKPQLILDNGSSFQQTYIGFKDNGTQYWQLGKNGGNSSFFLWDATASRNDISIAPSGDMGLMIGGGNVGIGTTNPTVTLDVVGSASISGNLTFRGGGAQQVNLLNNSTLGFYNSVGGDAGIGANPALYIANNGNIGIGTNSPVVPVHLEVDSNGNTFYLAKNTNNGGAAEAGFEATNNGSYNFIAGINGGIRNQGGISAANTAFVEGNAPNGLAIGSFGGGSSSVIRFSTAGSSEKMRLDSNGYLGIGTNFAINPALAALDVRGTSGTLPIASLSANTSFAGLIVDNSGFGDLFTASSSGLNRFVITQNGNVGVGTTIPKNKFDVNGGLAVGSYAGVNSSPSNGLIVSGTVGIGTNSPSSFIPSTGLVVVGNASAITSSAPVGIFSSNAQGANVGGSLSFGGNDGSVATRVFGTVAGFKENSSSGDTSGYLAFATRSNGNNPAERLRISSSGFVGIGTTAPNYRFDTIDTQNSTSSASITNLSTSDTANTNVLALNLGTATSGTNSRFIQFYAGANSSTNAVGVGRIQLNNGNVAYNTGGADFAEYFSKGTTPLTQGDIVTISSDGTATLATQKTGAIGIVSTTAGFVGNAPHDQIQEQQKVIVGLVGQLHVNVSTENGNIQPGDLLTLSSTPGVAMKATTAGITIGKALERYMDTDPHAVGTIQVVINISWNDPNIILTADGNLSVNGQTMGVVNTPSITKVLVAESILPSTTSLQTGVANGATIDQFNTLSTTVLGLQSQIASMSSQLGKIDDLSKQLAELQKTVNLNQLLSATSTQSAILGASTTNDDMSVGGKLNVLGRTVLSDLGVTGTINTGLLTINGLDTTNGTSSTTINTLSAPLKLQSLGLEGIDILNGKVTIDTSGNLLVNGDITAKTVHADKYEVTDIGNSASTGEAVIPAGQTQVIIKTSAVTAKSKIFVTPETLIKLPLVVTQKAAGSSFTVEVAEPQSHEVKFDWWIVN